MTRKLVSKKELKSVYGVPYCPAHIARLEAAGQFPKRVTLGACRVAWSRKKWKPGSKRESATANNIFFCEGQGVWRPTQTPFSMT